MRPNYDLPEGYDYRGGSIVQDLKHKNQMNKAGGAHTDDWSVQLADGTKADAKSASADANRGGGCTMYDGQPCAIF